MISRQQILEYLNNDDWFTPSKSYHKATIKDKSGKDMEVAESYYHSFTNGSQILVRVSEHGTSLNTWVLRRCEPHKSLQNLSVVFSDKPITSNLIINKDGNPPYFALEQYHYNVLHMSFKDFTKVIKTIKRLDASTVFIDPFRNKPSKKANRTVLTPNDRNGKKIPSNTNKVHPRQTTVIANPYKEVDANRNVLEKNLRVTANDLAKIIRECVHEELSKLLY